MFFVYNEQAVSEGALRARKPYGIRRSPRHCLGPRKKHNMNPTPDVQKMHHCHYKQTMEWD